MAVGLGGHLLPSSRSTRENNFGLEATCALSFANCGNFGMDVMWEVEVEIEPLGEISLHQWQF